MSDNTEDFKELINEKFKSVHTKIDLQFSGIKNTLESIDTQVKKTNGRVLKLEDTVYNLQLSDAMKSVNCPQHLVRMKEIEDEIENFKIKINSDLEEYNFFKKYPKIAVVTIAVVVITLLLGYSEIRSMILQQSNKDKIEVNTGAIQNQKSQINENTSNDKRRIEQEDRSYNKQ